MANDDNSNGSNVVYTDFRPVPAANTDPTCGPDEIPHVAGVAVCMDCQHEWVTIAPLGFIHEYECPACHAAKGHMKYPIHRNDREWTCKCGNMLFKVTPSYVYCPNCGTIPNLPTE